MLIAYKTVSFNAPPPAPARLSGLLPIKPIHQASGEGRETDPTHQSLSLGRG